MIIDDLILELCGQGLDKQSIFEVVRIELSNAGVIALWQDQEIKNLINLIF